MLCTNKDLNHWNTQKDRCDMDYSCDEDMKFDIFLLIMTFLKKKYKCHLYRETYSLFDEFIFFILRFSEKNKKIQKTKIEGLELYMGRRKVKWIDVPKYIKYEILHLSEINKVE